MRKLFLLAVLFAAAALSAAEQKYAVIDMDKVVRDYYKTRIVESNLKRQADIYREYAAKLQERIKRLQAEFMELRDASLNVVLTEAARESKRLAAVDKYKQLAALENELKDYNREKQAQMRDDQDSERTKILEDIRKVVKAQALLSGYVLVLDKSAVSVTSLPTVVYAADLIDLTNSVLKELNAGNKSVPPSK